MKMKKIMLFVACSSLLLSSCDTYTGSGAYAGATFGSILGSAIGGLSGGPRGSDMGTIIGMAGGAAVAGGLVLFAGWAVRRRDTRTRYAQQYVGGGGWLCSDIGPGALAGQSCVVAGAVGIHGIARVDAVAGLAAGLV